MATNPEKKRDLLARIDKSTHLERVNVKDMFLERYCRPVSHAQIGRMMRAGFSMKKLGILTLSFRWDTGMYAVIDGNHRRHLAIEMGIPVLPARVFDDLDYDEEAELFEALNTMSKPTALHLFNSRLERNEPRALDIQRILEKFDLHIPVKSNNTRPHRVTAVAQLDALYIERGPVEFSEVIEILHKAWEYDPSAYVSKMLHGMQLFWSRYKNEVDKARLISQLQLITPHRLFGLAGEKTQTDSSASLIGKYIVKLYDGQRRKKLPEWVDRVPGPTTTRGVVERKIGANVVNRVKKT